MNSNYTAIETMFRQSNRQNTFGKTPYQYMFEILTTDELTALDYALSEIQGRDQTMFYTPNAIELAEIINFVLGYEAIEHARNEDGHIEYQRGESGIVSDSTEQQQINQIRVALEYVSTFTDTGETLITPDIWKQSYLFNTLVDTVTLVDWSDWSISQLESIVNGQ